MDLVTINNGQAVTTSMKIAEYFGKKTSTRYGKNP